MIFILTVKWLTDLKDSRSVYANTQFQCTNALPVSWGRQSFLVRLFYLALKANDEHS
jgi:hypothetical protein